MARSRAGESLLSTPGVKSVTAIQRLPLIWRRLMRYLFSVCVCVCVCMCLCARVYVYVHIYVYVYICTIMYVYACVALTWRLVSVAADFGDLRFLGLLALGDLATPRGVKVTG